MQKVRKFPPQRAGIGIATALLVTVFAGWAAGGPTADVDAAAGGATISRSAPLAPDAGSLGDAANLPAADPRPYGSPAAGATTVLRASPDAPADTDGSLWDRIRGGFAMPELDSPLVAEKERFYLSKPEYLQRMFQRGGRYLFYIVEEIEKRGMPTELALLPFVESAMNPTALSSAQAAGLWQFIPSTGKAYDLQQNWWVDNRRDVVKSTQAALDYLQKIYEMHGNDWFLALASYNWGEGAVGRAVKKNQARGKPADYLSLDMPAETRHYVPKLIALKNILMRADALGVALPELPNRPYFVTVEKTRPIDLKLAAQFARMNVDEFVALNPAHNRPVIAASKNNEIKLPADRIDDFLKAVDKHEEAKKVFASWQPYTLKPGETIESIAQRKGVAPAEIRKANGIHASQRIVAGTRLLAPHREVEDERKVEHFVAPRVYEEIDRPARYHTVGHKESLASIARRYGVSAATLAAWNDIKKGVRRGMRLLVAPAATQTLLTSEDGDRSVVSSTPKPAFVRAVLRETTIEDAPQRADPERRRPSKAAAGSAGQRGTSAARAPAPASNQAKSRPASKSRPAAAKGKGDVVRTSGNPPPAQGKRIPGKTTMLEQPGANSVA